MTSVRGSEGIAWGPYPRAMRAITPSLEPAAIHQADRKRRPAIGPPFFDDPRGPTFGDGGLNILNRTVAVQ